MSAFHPLQTLRVVVSSNSMTPPLLSDDEAALLNDVSDDEYGLWELKGSVPPDGRAELISLLVSAIESGYVDVFAGQFGGERQKLPAAAAIRCVEDWGNWEHREPPQEVFGVMTSALGTEALSRR